MKAQRNYPTKEVCLQARLLWKRVNCRRREVLSDIWHTLPTLPPGITSQVRPLLLREIECLEELEDALAPFAP